MKTTYQKFLLLLLLLPFNLFAQSTLSGNVSDTTGQPVPGANVYVEGTSNATSTDMDGNFTLSGINSGDRIVVSFIGYADQVTEYTGQSTLAITMQEDDKQLQEVVVIGYGTVKKKDATGSVTSLTSEDFNKGTIVTAENLLNGRIAGVTVNTSGAPGSGSQIRIRGGASLSASNDPLIVLDGLPLDNNTNIGSTSLLAGINPNDIESFTVLKDASATAIYGSRASNGVIIINTKRGGKELKVSYNVTYGSGSVVDKIDVFSADEFREIIMERRPESEWTMLGEANTDWQDEIYRRTDFVDNNLSLNGNLFGVVPARLSLGNTYQEGLRLTNKFNRSTVSVSLNPSFLDNHLKFRVNANYANEKNRFADGVEYNAIHFNPTQPVRQAGSPYGGFFEYYNTITDGNGVVTNPLQLGTRNPVAQLLLTDDSGHNNRIFGNFETEYRFHFLPEMKAVVNVGFDQSKGERTRYASDESATSFTNNNIALGTNEYSERTLTNKLFDAYLNYNKTFGSLNFDGTAGYSYQIFEQESFYTGNVNNPSLGSNFPETDRDTDNVLIGFFGRANFSINDKYLLTLSYRRDGSSRFSEDNRWGNFPAAAFAWKIGEDLFKESKTVSDLKLRLGYGITGQQSFSEPNVYLQQYQIGNGNSQYVFGGSQYPIAVSKAYNPLIKWEETTTYNVGLDYGFFNDRVTGAIDVFYKESDDLLSYVPVADGSNFSNFLWQNIGSFTTKGIEFAINADVVRNDNFNWNVNFNATTYQRRIEELANNQDVILGGTGSGTGGNIQIHSEGFTPHSFYVYKQLYNEAGQPIEGAYADLNGDGILNESDRYIYKNADPDVTFGFASSMNYKNFDFSFNMRASIGNRIYNAVNAGNANLSLLKADAVLANVPQSVENTNFVNTADVVFSDIFVENGSFLRLDNVTLGYTFPKWLEGKASVRLFTGVQNALLITEYSGLDPEITNDGRDQTIYPRQRTWLFGANINF